LPTFFSIINSQPFENGYEAATHSYDFLMAMMRKLLQYRSTRAAFPATIDIVQLLAERLHLIFSGIKKRNFLSDIEAMIPALSNKEKMRLLQMLLGNVGGLRQRQRVKMVGLEQVIKLLIKTNFEEAFKCTAQWFPLLMKGEVEWITKQIPKHTSSAMLVPLFHGICEYVSSREFAVNPCDQAYIRFVSEYTDYEWKIE